MLGCRTAGATPPTLLSLSAMDRKHGLPRASTLALRRIWDITSPATLWIDALCNSLWVEAFHINQSRDPNGLRERQRQVTDDGTGIRKSNCSDCGPGRAPKNFDGLWKVFREINSIPKELYQACEEKGHVLEDFRYLTLDRPFWLTYTIFVSLPWFKRV
jgi:hypothetical protein